MKTPSIIGGVHIVNMQVKGQQPKPNINCVLFEVSVCQIQVLIYVKITNWLHQREPIKTVSGKNYLIYYLE